MFRFTLFDVGHGFCAYATTPGGADILFDCGYDNEFEFYPSTYFSDRGITRINKLVLSHFDQDHVCDLPQLREVLDFDVIMRNKSIPADFIRREKRSGGVVSDAMASALNMHETWTQPVSAPADTGGVRVTTFYNSYPTFTDMNNLSVVTFLEYSGCGIVIPGDLECAGWEELLKRPAFCQCLTETTIFIASHHGRNAGYCAKIFDYCKPHLIVLSDKDIVHDSQDHDYAKHASGVLWPGGRTRRVLTTRSDGHITIEKQAGQSALVTCNVVLEQMAAV